MTWAGPWECNLVAENTRLDSLQSTWFVLNAILVSKCFLVVKFVVLGVDKIISFWTEAPLTPPANVRDGPYFSPQQLYLYSISLTMPLGTIYLTRHGVSQGRSCYLIDIHAAAPENPQLTSPQHRLNWTIDLRTGTYKSQFPTPTGNPADPALTSHGVRQSYELAAHIASPEFHPKPFRVYSSPFYRCLQTIQPSVEELKRKQKASNDTSESTGRGEIDPAADFDVRLENGLG